MERLGNCTMTQKLNNWSLKQPINKGRNQEPN
jgi:hypothetical protein